MADVHDASTRSYNMSQIKGKNTKPELLVRKLLTANGYRYRLHVKKLPGSPDLVLNKIKVVIFVHGCFWHGHHKCRYFKIPSTKREWWTDKINLTKENDKRNTNELARMRWRVIEIWECELRPKKIINTTRKLFNELAETQN
jgi:DNA mismatch endonuclease (patch repair protein)